MPEDRPCRGEVERHTGVTVPLRLQAVECPVEVRERHGGGPVGGVVEQPDHERVDDQRGAAGLGDALGEDVDPDRHLVHVAVGLGQVQQFVRRQPIGVHLGEEVEGAPPLAEVVGDPCVVDDLLVVDGDTAREPPFDPQDAGLLRRPVRMSADEFVQPPAASGRDGVPDGLHGVDLRRHVDQHRPVLEDECAELDEGVGGPAEACREHEFDLHLSRETDQFECVPLLGRVPVEVDPGEVPRPVVVDVQPVEKKDPATVEESLLPLAVVQELDRLPRIPARAVVDDVDGAVGDAPAQEVLHEHAEGRGLEDIEGALVEDVIVDEVDERQGRVPRHPAGGDHESDRAVGGELREHADAAVVEVVSVVDEHCRGRVAGGENVDDAEQGDLGVVVEGDDGGEGAERGRPQDPVCAYPGVLAASAAVEGPRHQGLADAHLALDEDSGHRVVAERLFDRSEFVVATELPTGFRSWGHRLPHARAISRRSRRFET
jgi:hypothetical protein